MIKNLILDNDEVTLPGVGSFVSEVVPSSFSDKGYTINPPYRKLSFRHRQGKDNLMAEFYSKSNGTDLESAEKLVKVFLDGLEEDLRTKKTVEMPGLGRLRATREGTIFFIPDEDLDIYCSGFGLQPVSLKTHEETPEEVARAVSDLRKMVDDPVPPLKPLQETGQEETVRTKPEPVAATEPAFRPEPVPATEPASCPEPVAPDPASPASVEDSPAGPSAPVAAASTQDAPAAPATPVELPTPAAQDTPAAPASPDAPAAPASPDQSATQVSPAPSGNVRKKRLLTGVAVVIFIALFALGGFLLLSRLSPDLVDRMLYSEDELRLIERFEHYR
ncbi:MAG: hypothetical protein SPF58_08825 [Candidatus Cryptobacteroides sp.]|uniref:HU domain-containing protein n=1 Tax=Candidatus Cryptobacteroides sp. TaxID=2952915 RepID=UPI002A90C7B6|nr:hypothetical protein [Candidatus Cryptobacteroides sp.]MDY5567364.1 hypothetical protein [Candidatus Cryptobacteroides sp.]